ncbi:3-demethylubiquinone-9 3-O-methyltransferase [Phragmitibacter flavus]|uniref:3-demethylubiquinone-9 3-O-methyltransferase n=1 Tax=Phragmitibacter flavus TaxID=2576071 RepID=A0A5R8KHL3_9BACT|nr:bifunctional 2-polyprenyl-6-hydroxyphenol methylase/3-demethylubiquinol 3-O-methyltransferase UbiG [Phragmitibacter flavus]TLD71803.1 3-demethylubiquinone-9 3-O-methyltransferase [Phragmitibacter flavus]
MKAVSKEIYNRIDNDLYNAPEDPWWSGNSALSLLKTTVNPLRVGYFKRKLFQEMNIDPTGKTALEVGSGGGILTEEIAGMGFITTGIDPSENSVAVARDHAQQSGLDIRYDVGSGEALPYADASFDVVFCCDVLEHVTDLPKVIEEITRVLKPGGVFAFDTINRTFVSKLVAIKIWQEWKRWAFMPANLHVWEMFIKPAELKAVMEAKGLTVKEFRGSKPSASIPTMLKYLRKRAKGEWTFKQLSEKFLLIEDKDMNILYMGLSVKP